jgi:hypothetical protein
VTEKLPRLSRRTAKRAASVSLHVMIEPERRERYLAAACAAGMTMSAFVVQAMETAVAGLATDGDTASHGTRIRTLETRMDALAKECRDYWEGIKP